MPWGDRSGPAGAGPMTGRGAGYCAGYSVPGYMNPGYGLGFGPGRGAGWGRGRAGGRGWRHWHYATGWPGWARAGWGPFGYDPAYTYGPAAWPGIRPQDELAALKDEAKHLEAALRDANKRIDELKAAEKATAEKKQP